MAKYPYPAVVFHCNWCNAVVRKEELLTRRVRNREMDGEQYEVVECPNHAGIGGELDKRLNDWQMQKKAALEVILAEERPGVAAAFERDLLGDKAIMAAPDAPKRGKSKSRGPEIPIPPSLQN